MYSLELPPDTGCNRHHQDYSIFTTDAQNNFMRNSAAFVVHSVACCSQKSHWEAMPLWYTLLHVGLSFTTAWAAEVDIPTCDLDWNFFWWVIFDEFWVRNPWDGNSFFTMKNGKNNHHFWETMWCFCFFFQPPNMLATNLRRIYITMKKTWAPFFLVKTISWKTSRLVPAPPSACFFCFLYTPSHFGPSGDGDVHEGTHSLVQNRVSCQ